ncbi:MAG TPA: carboxypeptidase-like regulatory domain-containing protein, partial [Archangium sp.]|nr:carboxypeptidase-like regulatory domain-containing protein [Archangium sp.]
MTTNGTPAAGQPVAGRPLEAAVAPASTGALVGRVLISGTDAGLGGVEVVARGPEGHVARTVSDAAGTWRLEGLAPGTWRLQLGLTDWQPRELSTRVVAGSAVAAGDVELAPLEVSEDIQVVAQAGPARRLRESSESVTVVELGAARERAADLSEVLRRGEG